jgi:dynein heavy chain
LDLLNNSKGFILDDVELIGNLKESKKVSSDVNRSLEESEIRSLEIETARAVYKPVAVRGALLYMIVSELSVIEAMYQFSLEYFARIFRSVLISTPATPTTDERVSGLLTALTKTTYLNISRALFNQHKKIFAFVMACRIASVPKIEYDYFNKGSFALPKVKIDKTKKDKEQIKPILGLNNETMSMLLDLNRVFPNKLIEVFSHDKDLLSVFN